MEQMFYVTQKGLEDLKAELKNWKERRKQVAERIKNAREFGDLAENSEYEDAKNEQSFVEGRILELEETLRRSRVVDHNGGDKVGIGSKVSLKIDGKTLEYIIVGTSEAEPSAGKISSESPIGFSLMNKSKGEKVEITTPTGKMTCKIIDIK